MKILREYIRELLIEKRWADFHAPKGQVIPITPEDFEPDACPNPPCPEVRNLDDEIFDLIQTAYSDVELTAAMGDTPATYGNIKVQSPSDLPGRYTIMKAADLDADPEPDYFRGGKMRSGRFKLGIVGHDGSDAAINKYLEETARELKSGAIAEMSGAIASIMITRHGVPAITTKEEVEAMLGKRVDWIGRHPTEKYAKKYESHGNYEGWYTRGITGAAAGDHTKILLGGA